MRAPARPAVPRRPALLEQLLGVVRPEFRAEVLMFAAEDPVFGGGVCRVEGCPRAARSKGMCPGHHLRWVGEGRPDPSVFAATTDLRWRRQRPNAECRVAGCGYGVARGGMCQLHGQRWDRAGRPDLHGWLADPPTIKAPSSGAVCVVEHCDLWPQAALPLCHAHANTWKVNGRPETDVFVRRFEEVAVTAEEIIRLDLLGPQLRLEIQYMLQCRHDQRGTKTLPAVVMAVVRALAATGAVSLLDRTEAQWRTGIGRPAPRDSNLRALLIDARRGLRCMTRFALFCERIGLTALADLDRVVLERYLADLHAELAGRQRHGDQIGQLNSFLHAVRQHHWDDTLPATALVFTEDYPARVERAPRALAEQVMAQIEHPDNLARFTHPAYRLLTLILIRAGLRVTDALSVSRDCDGGTVHATYYPPTNHAVTTATQPSPPLILQPHPGPTSHTPLRLDLRTQFFTSRGFAVAAVDYRGSTGYGRAYRTALDGQWGVLDVQDCLDVAAFLAERGTIDTHRTIISGASAGGFTTLRALTATTNRCAGGASWYGITDLAMFRAHVPRFQRHHTDHLIGAWPDTTPRYRERSPAHNAAQVTQPVLVIYGLDDDIVPPQQAEAIVQTLRQRGVPVTPLAFPGEGHGLRHPDSIRHAIETELTFYRTLI